MNGDPQAAWEVPNTYCAADVFVNTVTVTDMSEGIPAGGANTPAPREITLQRHFRKLRLKSRMCGVEAGDWKEQWRVSVAYESGRAWSEIARATLALLAGELPTVEEPAACFRPGGKCASALEDAKPVRSKKGSSAPGPTAAPKAGASDGCEADRKTAAVVPADQSSTEEGCFAGVRLPLGPAEVIMHYIWGTALCQSVQNRRADWSDLYGAESERRRVSRVQSLLAKAAAADASIKKSSESAKTASTKHVNDSGKKSKAEKARPTGKDRAGADRQSRKKRAADSDGDDDEDSAPKALPAQKRQRRDSSL